MPSVSTRPLTPALAPFVTGLHYLEADVDRAAPAALERILPSGRVHVMVNLHEDEFRTYHGGRSDTVRRCRGAVLEGPASGARVIDTGLMRCLMSVDFALGGAAAFFKLPLSEAEDELVELDLVWRADGASLRERMLDAPTPAAKLRVLERVLVDHLVRRGEPDRAATGAASLLERGTPVANVASHVGLLPRTLVRRFRTSFGLTPKRFSRVRRLQRVIGSLPAGDVDWCEVAAVHGYSDQAHLVHDFRELTGITPTAYRARSADARNHVPMRSGSDPD